MSIIIGIGKRALNVTWKKLILFAAKAMPLSKEASFSDLSRRWSFKALTSDDLLCFAVFTFSVDLQISKFNQSWHLSVGQFTTLFMLLMHVTRKIRLPYNSIGFDVVNMSLLLVYGLFSGVAFWGSVNFMVCLVLERPGTPKIMLRYITITLPLTQSYHILQFSLSLLYRINVVCLEFTRLSINCKACPTTTCFDLVVQPYTDNAIQPGRSLEYSIYYPTTTWPVASLYMFGQDALPWICFVASLSSAPKQLAAKMSKLAPDSSTLYLRIALQCFRLHPNVANWYRWDVDPKWCCPPPLFFWELNLFLLLLSSIIALVNILYGDALYKKTRTFNDSTRL